MTSPLQCSSVLWHRSQWWRAYVELLALSRRQLTPCMGAWVRFLPATTRMADPLQLSNVDDLNDFGKTREI